MAWCLTRGVSVVRREDLPTSVERHLIVPGLLDLPVGTLRNIYRQAGWKWSDKKGS